MNKKNLFKSISAFMDDNKRFNDYYTKNYPITKKVLPLLKLACYLMIGFLVHQNYMVYASSVGGILLSKSSELLMSERSFWIVTIYVVYLSLIAFELVLSIRIIFIANHPIENRSAQILKYVVTAGVGSYAGVYFISYAPIEPSPISNFFHTTMPGGRGYDTESMFTRLKADVMVSLMGSEQILKAVADHANESRILTKESLNSITADPVYRKMLMDGSTGVERAALGLVVCTSEESREMVNKTVGSFLSRVFPDVSSANEASNETDFSKSGETISRRHSAPVRSNPFRSPIRRHNSAPPRSS